MNEYIGKAVERYSSLFSLPSHKTLLMLLLATCLLIGILIATALKFAPPYWLAVGLALGTTLFVLTLVSDVLIHFSSQSKDPVFTVRRCSALSLYSLLIWLVFIFVGVVTNLFYSGIWIKLFWLGFCVALALRILVFSSVSFAGVAKIAFFAALLPVLYTIPVFYTASAVSTLLTGASLMTFFFLSVAVTSTATILYIFFINRVGLEIVGVTSFSVLKAFMASWTEDQSAPFENLFERFSKESDIPVSALSFISVAGRVKAMLIVPVFHPGPFKNVGSSALPYAIQTALENKLEHAVVSVPHGLSGHDLDLASQAQNQLTLDRVLTLSGISNFGSFATPFEHVRSNGATVGCQVFNGCALVTLTLAPETMEDLPPELNAFIVEAAEKYGFSTAIAVDAHNSIQGPFKIDKAINPLKAAALTCLQKASKHQPTSFQIGAAKVTPKDFGLREGMGPGGITALVVRVGDQTTAYITIDGNNMISGLRERILSALSEIGVNEGEVFTTDTHAVNAVVLNARGYHPVGEVINHESLIKHVKQATTDALANLEPAEVGWRTEMVSGVKVIGENQIEAMCMLLDKATKRAKKLALSIFPIAGVILIALLLLL